MSGPGSIVAEGLCKEFADDSRGVVRAVAGISFEVAPGEVLGLLGVNGAGKTTTLRMLATLLQPTSGTARVAGFDIKRDPASVRRSLGFLSSTTALQPRLTPREVLRLFAVLSGMPRADVEDRVGEVVGSLGLEGFADTRIDRLSTGMRQKVSIARAIVHDPPVLVFDEPTAGLDVLNAHAMLDTILGLRGGGRAILFSTHMMHEAERICDRIAVIHEGSLRAESTPRGLLEATGCGRLEDAFVRIVKGAQGG